MADSHDSKKYVSRVDLLARSENPLEIKALLHCSGFMNQRYLAAVVWLVASGPSGLNAAEAASLSGLDLVAVDAALHTLRTRGLLRLAPVLPGDLGERFVFDFSRLRLELGEPESETKLESESRKNLDENEKNSGMVFATRGAFTERGGNLDTLIVSSKEEYSSSISLGLPRLIAPENRKLKRKILKSTKDKIEKIKAWEIENPGGLSAPEGEPSGSPSCEQTKTQEQRPEGISLSGRVGLAGEFNQAKDKMVERRIEAKKIARSYLGIPSENPMLQGWKEKDNPERWRGLDWVGYWLQHYRAFYGAEDPRFVGYLPYRPKSEKASTNVYYETANKIMQFRDHDRCFRGDAAGLRTFFDWLFREYLPSADWVREPLGIVQATKLTSNIWLEKFKARHIKVKGKETKGKGRWRPWGYEIE